MPQSDNQLAAYYAARAQEYDRIYEKPERQADLARLRELIPAYFVDRAVLEIACGTGYWTQFIATAARSVTATDINPETLAIARSRPYPPGRVQFDVADATSLSDHYKGFTGAFVGFWWSHMRRADRRPFIEALHRTLASGALVAVVDNRYVEGSNTPIAMIDADGNSFQRRRLADGSEHRVLKNFPTEAELTGELGSDCTGIEYTAFEYYWVLKYEISIAG